MKVGRHSPRFGLVTRIMLGTVVLMAVSAAVMVGGLDRFYKETTRLQQEDLRDTLASFWNETTAQWAQDASKLMDSALLNPNVYRAMEKQDFQTLQDELGTFYNYSAQANRLADWTLIDTVGRPVLSLENPARTFPTETLIVNKQPITTISNRTKICNDGRQLTLVSPVMSQNGSRVGWMKLDADLGALLQRYSTHIGLCVNLALPDGTVYQARCEEHNAKDAASQASQPADHNKPGSSHQIVFNTPHNARMVILHDNASMDRSSSRETLRTITAVAVLVCTSLLGVWLYILKKQLRPIKQLSHAMADAIGSADFQTEVTVPRGTELREMALAFNTLTRRVSSTVRELDASERTAQTALADLANQKLVLDKHSIVSIADVRGNISYVNDKFCQISGYSREELIGQNHRLVKSNEHDRAFYRDLWLTISRGETWHGHIKNRAKNGSHYWVDATIVPFKDKQGRVTQYVAVRTDITQQMHSEQRVKENEERYKLAVRGSRDGIWDWDLLNDRVYYAPQWKQMLGLGPEHEVSDRPDEWISRIDERDVGMFMQEFNDHLSGEDAVFEVELRMKHKQGRTVWMLCRGAVVRDEQGKAVRVAGSMADITEIKDVQDKLRHVAEHDRLTGLPNRDLFHKRLQKALDRNAHNPEHKFAVLFFDFDRFKVINDSLGHDVGDALLVNIAQRFRTTLREHDTAARFGGDEFVVLLNSLSGYDEAMNIARRLLDAFQKPHTLNGHEVISTASIGLVTNESHYDTPEAILRDADAAMYQAKEAGKARIVVFDQAMHENAVDQLQMEADLREALENDQFHLVYQPIVSLDAGELHGFEALLRWEHPQRGFVSPAKFIPIAEDTGLIVPIGEWVLRKACQQLRQWNHVDRPELPVTLNVNLSMRQVCHPGILDVIRSAIYDARIDPQYLKLEVTESTIVDDRHDMIPLLNQIKELGIRLAMDDFGTGHSSLGNLHMLPIDVLKIDQSFIKSMSANRELAAVMHAIISLAHELGMETVAEGIETAEQLVMLQSLDCNFGQGYYFQKPMRTDQATRYLLGLDDTAASA